MGAKYPQMEAKHPQPTSFFSIFAHFLPTFFCVFGQKPPLSTYSPPLAKSSVYAPSRRRVEDFSLIYKNVTRVRARDDVIKSKKRSGTNPLKVSSARSYCSYYTSCISFDWRDTTWDVHLFCRKFCSIWFLSRTICNFCAI